MYKYYVRFESIPVAISCCKHRVSRVGSDALLSLIPCRMIDFLYLYCIKRMIHWNVHFTTRITHVTRCVTHDFRCIILGLTHCGYFVCNRFMKQVRPNGVMEDSPLPSPVTSPNHTTEVVGVSVGGEEEEPKHRKGVKRSLENVEGEKEWGRERERERERKRGRDKGERGCKFDSKRSQILERGRERVRWQLLTSLVIIRCTCDFLLRWCH